jgi:hypothetical protein
MDDERSADITDEFLESAVSREGDALYRHLHEAEAEHFGWTPQTEADGWAVAGDVWKRWPLGSVPALALTMAFDAYVNRLHEVYGREGDAIGWSYWAVRDMRDLLNGILERHHVWRRQALARGRPTPHDEPERP